ncbi:hypothetical protein J4421_03915 [Candidatus Woesearchaeota archaeon]|nr:hypothetical protein [Candidatus Woesearchaeota archaeon]
MVKFKKAQVYSSTILLIVSFLITACLPSQQVEDTLPTIVVEKAAPSPLLENKTDTTLPSETLSDCTSSWVCISTSMKAYRNASCGFSQKTECELGCINGTCKKLSTCEAGFKCKNNQEKGFQKEDCNWIKRTKCDYGCENGECKPPENISNISTQGTSSTPVVTLAEIYPVLKAGESVNITANITLRIYLLEAERVRLEMNNQKTDWLLEGGSFKFKSGTIITVREILFQAYAGGKKEIIYEID